MLQGILREVDTNGDGRIDPSGRITSSAIHAPDLDHLLLSAEFRAFVDHTEDGLWQMFQRIDRNHNGEIDKTELRNAFANSGVTVSNTKLDQFFAEVDKNHDGVISYAEWRFDTHTSQVDAGKPR